jgi:hypothetical protein
VRFPLFGFRSAFFIVNFTVGVFQSAFSNASFLPCIFYTLCFPPPVHFLPCVFSRAFSPVRFLPCAFSRAFSPVRFPRALSIMCFQSCVFHHAFSIVRLSTMRFLSCVLKSDWNNELIDKQQQFRRQILQSVVQKLASTENS